MPYSVFWQLRNHTNLRGTIADGRKWFSQNLVLVVLIFPCLDIFRGNVRYSLILSHTVFRTTLDVPKLAMINVSISLCLQILWETKNTTRRESMVSSERSVDLTWFSFTWSFLSFSFFLSFSLPLSFFLSFFHSPSFLSFFFFLSFSFF